MPVLVALLSSEIFFLRVTQPGITKTAPARRKVRRIGVIALVGEDVAGFLHAGEEFGAMVTSDTLPGVSISLKGRPTTLVGAWTFVVWPPREGPMAAPSPPFPRTQSAGP